MIDNENNNCENVAGLFNNSPRTVSNWVHKINISDNIDILKDKKKPGNKPRLNQEQMNFIKNSLIKHPSDFDLSKYMDRQSSVSFYKRTIRNRVEDKTMSKVVS